MKVTSRGGVGFPSTFWKLFSCRMYQVDFASSVYINLHINLQPCLSFLQSPATEPNSFRQVSTIVSALPAIPRAIGLKFSGPCRCLRMSNLGIMPERKSSFPSSFPSSPETQTHVDPHVTEYATCSTLKYYIPTGRKPNLATPPFLAGRF